MDSESGSPTVSRAQFWKAGDYSQYVYFIRINGDGPIKIGRADNPNKRLMDLLCATPYPLEIIGVIDTFRRGAEFVETELHKRFDHHRIRGEWFEAAAEILDFIAVETEPWPWERETFMNRTGKQATRFVSRGVIRDKRGDFRYVYSPYSDSRTIRRIVGKPQP